VIIGVLNNGGNLLAINSVYLQIAIGVLILVAVGFDQLNTRRSART
jgi:ribose transport system permease protein